MSQGGFTDLRLNGSGHDEIQEGFWPSFTDIMTVVVMIFLISMVVLLIRNMELVHQLRATMEAERIAAELARATGEEKDSLSSALHRAEERVQQMQLEIMRLQEKGLRSEALIAEQLRAISGLSNERDDLAQQAAQLALLRERLESDVARRQAQIDAAKVRYPGLTVIRPDLPGLDPAWTSAEGGLRLRPDYWPDRGGMDGFYIATLRNEA